MSRTPWVEVCVDKKCKLLEKHAWIYLDINEALGMVYSKSGARKVLELNKSVFTDEEHEDLLSQLAEIPEEELPEFWVLSEEFLGAFRIEAASRPEEERTQYLELTASWGMHPESVESIKRIFSEVAFSPEDREALHVAKELSELPEAFQDLFLSELARGNTATADQAERIRKWLDWFNKGPAN